MSDVGLLSFAILGNFAFDGEWAVVADIEESLEVAFHTNVTVSEGDFLAPCGATNIGRGPAGIFAVDAANVATDFAECFDGFSGAVEDHIRGIKVDEEVIALDIADELEEVIGGFLTCFEVELLSVGADVVEEIASGVDEVFVVGAGRIVWYEADMEGDSGAAEEFGEVADFLHFLEACGAGLLWDEPDGASSGGDIGVAFAIEPSEDGRDGDVGGAAAIEEGGGGGGCASTGVGGVHLDGGDTEFPGDFEMDTQSGIDGGKDTDGPI